MGPHLMVVSGGTFQTGMTWRRAINWYGLFVTSRGSWRVVGDGHLGSCLGLGRMAVCSCHQVNGRFGILSFS